jgi:hypothetical protein
MSQENNFDNYLSDYISTGELQTLLTYVKKKEPGEPILIFTVNDSGDGMVTGEASTWMQISTARTDMICYMLKDDEGKSELNRFEMTISGLADCLDALSSQQDEVDYDGFYESVKKLIV